MKEDKYYASTTIVGWRPVVYGPNEESYQIKTYKGKIRLRRVYLVSIVAQTFQTLVKPLLKSSNYADKIS